jgi:uncharacterized integral membrane protein
MSRVAGVISVFLVLLLAMGFAATNAGHRVTLSLGLITLYQVPVTLVAFFGLLLGMLVMFATGIHSDLKVRRILRERLAEESRREKKWIDRNQQDLFSADSGADTVPGVLASEPLLEPEPSPEREHSIEPGPPLEPKPLLEPEPPKAEEP